MMQDSKGYIWIAGDSGPSRYDSYNVKSFINNPLDETSYPGGSAFSFFEDENGLIWVGSGFGISIYNDETGFFLHLQVPESMSAPRGVREIIQADDGFIWAAGVGGVYRITTENAKSGIFKTDYFEIDSNFEGNIAVWTVQQRTNTSLWIGTTNGVYIFDIKEQKYSRLQSFGDEADIVLDTGIWQILRDSKNNVWFTSEGGLAVWKDGQSEPERITKMGDSDVNLANEMIQSITEDNYGHIWIGTAFIGALKFDPETKSVQTFRRSINSQSSILEDDIHYVFVDSEDNVWFGYHDLGVSVMYARPWDYSFSLLPESSDPNHAMNLIRDVLDDGEGNLWMATGAGLVKYSPETHSMRLFTPSSNGRTPSANEGNILGIFLDKGKILTMTIRNTYFEFDIESERFTKIEFPEAVRQLPAYTMKSNDYTDSHYYIGTWGLEKIYQIDRETLLVSEVVMPRRNPDRSVDRAIIPVISPDGTVYVKFAYRDNLSQFSGDIFLLDEGAASVSQIELGYPDNITTYTPPTFSKSQEGVYWFLTNQGLLRRDVINRTNQFLFRSEAGVLGESNGRITEDSEGNLWFGALSRVYKLDPRAEMLSIFEADPARKPVYFAFSTLLSNGDIIFSGPGGFVRFDPEVQQESGVIKNIHITELKAGADFYRTVNPLEKYEIDHSNNNISLSFLALNFRDPLATRYRYRLTGYMDNWLEIGVQRSIYLANLPPGNYTFEVQAAQNYGSYSSNTAKLNISILPPWWRTIPAYLLFAMMFAGTIFTVDRVQRKRVISKEREMIREKELAQAKEIEKAYQHLKAAQDQLVQQEKLASLGQLTAGIAHEIKNPLNFVNNFSEVSEEMVVELIEALGKGDISESLVISKDIGANLRKIHEHGTRADSIVKSMLLHSRGGSGKVEPTDLNAVVKEYVNLAFHGMRASKNPISVDIDLALDESVGKVPLISEDFSRVILNLCNNAFDAMMELQTLHKSDSDVKANKGAYKPMLTVRTYREAKKIYIDIEDNGPGIPNEIKDKILQPFFTTKKGTAGTGLGLSITNDIIKAHGGELQIKSAPVAGTVFTIALSV
jgi:signal transduction histidine kinase/ligand-binding sensor domain-containing protein